MNPRLFVQALVKFTAGALLTGLMLFCSAGSADYFNGWLFLALLFIPMFIAGIVMMIKAPELLKSRLDSKESLGTQKTVIAFSGIMFSAGFILSGLNFRFGWHKLPDTAVYIASFIFAAAYLLYAEVLRENAYLSRTIKVQENQKVIDTGLYGIVRHPMYMVTLFMFISIPLILGSIYALPIFLIYPVLIVKRIKSEEIFLEKELNGYSDYRKKVRYRLIPFIW